MPSKKSTNNEASNKGNSSVLPNDASSLSNDSTPVSNASTNVSNAASSSSNLSTPLSNVAKRLFQDDTPSHNEWLEAKDNLIYFDNAGERKHMQFADKRGGGKDVQTYLFVIDGRIADSNKIRLEVWGEKESQLFANFFSKAVVTMGENLFALQNNDHIADNDGHKLVLIKHPPNKFQEDFKFVLKLQTKGKKKNATALVPEAFPRVVKWKEGKYYNEDGTSVGHPSTWADERLDESAINFDDLLLPEGIDTASPWKKSKL